MSLVPGLSPNIRQPGPEMAPANDAGVTVELADAPTDSPDIDAKGNILRISHGDGAVTVSLDGTPLGSTATGKHSGWFSNLVDDIDQMELSRISSDLLRGIDDDISSRTDWIEARTTGIKLLGLTIEVPGLTGASEGAPVEGMSKVRHPLLLEAVLRFQANARSEMLPTDGPVKIRNDDINADIKEDEQANALETDLNHYLTVTASEYYPDTDRMLLMLGFGGTAFKKVYYCPLRQRPVSETVDADDLIVNNSATDLKNGRRVTHRTYMRPSTVRRMQIIGAYRDISLSQAVSPKLDSLQLAEKEQQGISPDSMNPDDRDREIYECYCELDLKGHEHKYKGSVSGLEIPYCVTIDVSSREILSIVRNYDQDTKDLPESKTRFVKYTFVPGLGFYDIGLLHILGNTTNALTAAWRELLDMGMFANFPGFLVAKAGTRQNTNIFRVPPGGGAQIDTQGAPINQSVMPLPYNAQGMPALMALVGDVSQTGMRIGGTSEQQVGEGRADAPVGTTLAMIEQATKVMNAVHKRMHAAQAEELRLLRDCFREHPESFFQRKCKSKTKWDESSFIEALNNCELTPQADPNTASHGQRVMKIMALKQLQGANPSMYDPIAIDTAALQAIGYSNPAQFFAPPQSMSQPPPEMLEIQAKMAAEGKKADASMITARSRQAEVKAKAEQGGYAAKPGLNGAEEGDGPAAMMTAKARLMDAETGRHEAGIKHRDSVMEDHNRDLDRQAKERETVIGLAKEIMMSHMDAARAVDEAKTADDGIKTP